MPRPALVLIQTIDNDVRCDGSDPEHVRQFGEALVTTLDAIVAASPESRILMVGARSIEPWVDFLRAHPDMQASLPEGHGYTDHDVGTGMCDVFDPAGQVVPQTCGLASPIRRREPCLGEDMATHRLPHLPGRGGPGRPSMISSA